MISSSLFASSGAAPGSFAFLASRSAMRSFRAANVLRMSAFDFASIQTQASMITSSINAWSVSGSTLNASDLASTCFAASLFPYLAMLFFLSRKETKTPSVSFFGFSFLLAFVAATIPAGIYAKYQYHEILANVDWLHGLAESLLTVTNLLIITGFRQTRPASSTEKSPTRFQLQNSGLVVLGVLFGIISLFGSDNLGFLTHHPEPWNALSFPTWMVHSSSILEWLVAMTLIWDHAYTSSNPRWKGMTIAMIPAHASGMCACAFHLFYNNPDLYWMVALQAGLTVVGNTCMATAAYRIFDYERKALAPTPVPADSTFASTDIMTDSSSTAQASVVAVSGGGGNGGKEGGGMETPRAPAVEPDTVFFSELLLKSILLAGIVKYGELYLDFPFTTSSAAAAATIALPVLQNIFIWAQRSTANRDFTYH